MLIEARKNAHAETCAEGDPCFLWLTYSNVKRGITLDLTRAPGLQLAKRLIADADVVVDNYSVEVLPRLGLGYDVGVITNSVLPAM